MHNLLLQNYLTSLLQSYLSFSSPYSVLLWSPFQGRHGLCNGGSTRRVSPYVMLLCSPVPALPRTFHQSNYSCPSQFKGQKHSHRPKETKVTKKASFSALILLIDVCNDHRHRPSCPTTIWPTHQQQWSMRVPINLPFQRSQMRHLPSVILLSGVSEITHRGAPDRLG